jgi:CheY-like chemotaxis protein
VGVVHRLRDLGLPASSIATALRGVVGQRLVRKLCQHCAEPVAGKMNREEQMLADRHGVAPVRRAVGCKRCSGTGYRGRAAVAEVLMATPAFADAIVRAAPPSELHTLATSSGMRPLRKVAADLVTDGVTSIQELDRVVGSDATVVPAAAVAKEQAPRVLVIDDDELIRTLARALLEKAGMKVTEAEDGEHALAHLDRGEEFDLVLLDLDMPKLGGMDVLQAIRGKLTTAGLPVVVLTGSEAEHDEVRVMEAGADDYVRKPIVPDRLLTRIKSVLRRASS